MKHDELTIHATPLGRGEQHPWREKNWLDAGAPTRKILSFRLLL